MIQIDFINQATNVTNEQADNVRKALQTQVDEHFSPVWGVGCVLSLVPKGSTPDPTHWWMVLLDTAEQAGYLGYHDLTETGLPIGKVFVETTKANGCQWSVTASHELLELLVDPWINLCVLTQSFPTCMGVPMLVAYECADAPEQDNYGYMIGDVLVSDFVYPAYFEEQPVSNAKLDYLDHIKKPFEILPGGYLSTMLVSGSGGWQQTQNNMGISARKAYRNLPWIGSRRERRQRGVSRYIRSDVRK